MGRGIAHLLVSSVAFSLPLRFSSRMAPMKKATSKAVRALSKGAVAAAVAEKCEMKKSAASNVLNVLTELVTAEVSKTGKFVLPGVCMIKTRFKPATKAGKKIAFGKDMVVKAKPARTIVKCFPVSALKQSI